VEGTATPNPIRISAQDVGSRVVVRYHLAPSDHGPYGESLSDLLGELLSWDDAALAVRRKDGETVVVATSLVVAAKVVPPTPERRVRPAP